MRITDLHVDGFGVWHDLRLKKLSPEITVFYGPNEAGKTTLMQFMRTMLYGVSPERRERYLPPREGGKPGGRMGVHSEAGLFEVARFAERDKDDRGRVTIHKPDGETEGDRLLREALEGVDEATYNNVFSVGLDEIQTIGALSGDEVAMAIYRLTSGLDRVSLYDVIQGLRSSRTQLLGSAESKSIIGDLITRRDALLNEISELSAQGRRWSKIAVELDEVGVRIEHARGRLKDAELAARRVEIAIGLKPQWTERARIDERLLGFADLHVLADKAIEQLDALNAEVDEHARQRDMLRGQRKQVRQEIDELGVNEALLRNGCRLDALGEQVEWIEALEREAEQGDAQLNQLTARIQSEEARLAAMWSHDPAHAPELTTAMVDELEPQGKAIAAAERAVRDTREQLDRKRSSERTYQAKIETAMAAGGRMGLPTDIAEAGELVARLRRRQQAESKRELAERHARELEDQGFELEDRQVIPLEGFVFMGGLFMVGVLLCGWWLIHPTTAFKEFGGGWAALFGFGLAVGVWMVKYYREDNAAGELDGNERQMEVAAKQIKEAERDLKALNSELSLTDGQASLQLQHAERHLAELEQTLPIETQRRQANEEVAAAEADHESAKQRLAEALRRWSAALASLGLPASITPGDLAAMASQHEQLAEWRLKAENRRDEVERRAREYERVTQRIAALAEEGDLVVEDATPLEQLEALLSERRLQQTRIDHRKKLVDRSRALKEKQQRHADEIERLEQRREGLFRAARCDDEDGYRRLAEKLSEAAGLRQRREHVTREITAAIGRLGEESDFAPMLAADQIGQLDGQWQKLLEAHETIEAELRDLQTRRGSLAEQQKLLGEDATLADKRMELGEVEAQLEAAQQRWRERAVISQMLELIRSDYEANRQPETLVEASRYMSQLTSGRYTRVWTPLANDILLVDNQEGQSIAVEALSRGTREQLFLSVRLALVAMYARRGVQLPMVLDDILVNFDAGRSRIAAQVMIDFAKAGHQLFVFTCHEHVWEIFKDLHADVRRLPSRYEEVVEEAPELLEAPPAPEPQAQDAPAPAPVEVVAPPAEREPEPAPIEASYLELRPLRRVEPQEFLEAVYEDLPPRSEGAFDLGRSRVAASYDYPREPDEIEYHWDDLADLDARGPHHERLSPQAELDVYAVLRR